MIYFRVNSARSIRPADHLLKMNSKCWSCLSPTNRVLCVNLGVLNVAHTTKLQHIGLVGDNSNKGGVCRELIAPSS